MKFCDNCKKEININANYCTMCGNQLINKKNKTISSSIVSIVLFLVVISLIIYALIITDGEWDNPAVGFIWPFMVFIPSFPLIIASTILSIDVVTSYFKTKKINGIIQKGQKILVIINIIQLILTGVSIIIFLVFAYVVPVISMRNYTETINQEQLEQTENYYDYLDSLIKDNNNRLPKLYFEQTDEIIKMGQNYGNLLI